VIVESDGELVQKSDPVYVFPRNGGFFSAQFYAPVKLAFGRAMKTLVANILLLWAMTIGLAVTLKYELFPWVVSRFDRGPQAS
jgi:hypothetical protein